MKKATVWCPYKGCNGAMTVSQGNGTYECPHCRKEIKVHVFDGCFTTQPDGVTCGWAVSMWLLKSFRLRVPSGKRLREELHVEKLFGMLSGTIPRTLKKVMENHGLTEVLDGDGEDKPFSVRNAAMNWLFDRHGRAAVCYACIDPFGYGGVYAHWVGLERRAGVIRVMDPMEAEGYKPVLQWNREHRRYIDSIIAAYGFVKS